MQREGNDEPDEQPVALLAPARPDGQRRGSSCGHGIHAESDKRRAKMFVKRSAGLGRTPRRARLCRAGGKPLSCSRACSRLDGISPTRETHSLTNRSARPVDENARGAPDFFGHVHFRRNELRREPGIQTNQVVRDENLPVAMLARADPDRWNPDRVGDSPGRVRRDNFEHDRKGARCFNRARILQQALRLRRRRALSLCNRPPRARSGAACRCAP